MVAIKWAGLRDIRPFGKASPPPRIVLRDGMKLRQIESKYPCGRRHSLIHFAKCLTVVTDKLLRVPRRLSQYRCVLSLAAIQTRKLWTSFKIIFTLNAQSRRKLRESVPAFNREGPNDAADELNKSLAGKIIR